jgi:curved DNA-binding protein CbpA
LQFQDINEALPVLSDPERRAEYDAKWHPELKFRRRSASLPARPTPTAARVGGAGFGLF